jgi:hypothetical protein
MGGCYCIKGDFGVWIHLPPFYTEKHINQKVKSMEKIVKFFKTPHSPEVIIATPLSIYTVTIHGKRSR